MKEELPSIFSIVAVAYLFIFSFGLLSEFCVPLEWENCERKVRRIDIIFPTHPIRCWLSGDVK
jgi:hypothetical protein